jgi:hypothetical protein
MPHNDVVFPGMATAAITDIPVIRRDAIKRGEVMRVGN